MKKSNEIVDPMLQCYLITLDNINRVHPQFPKVSCAFLNINIYLAQKSPRLSLSPSLDSTVCTGAPIQAIGRSIRLANRFF